MKIDLKIQTKSINKIVAYLRAIKRDFDERCEQFVARLAQLGADGAKIDYQAVNYLGDNDVEIDVIKTAEGYEVVASGRSVIFIEFGSGMGATHPQADEFDYGSGTWSKRHGIGKFYRDGYWYYDGVKLKEQQPAQAMFNASKNMRNQILKIAREVFR